MEPCIEVRVTHEVPTKRRGEYYWEEEWTLKSACDSCGEITPANELIVMDVCGHKCCLDCGKKIMESHTSQDKLGAGLWPCFVDSCYKSLTFYDFEKLYKIGDPSASTAASKVTYVLDLQSIINHNLKNSHKNEKWIKNKNDKNMEKDGKECEKQDESISKSKNKKKGQTCELCKNNFKYYNVVHPGGCSHLHCGLCVMKRLKDAFEESRINENDPPRTRYEHASFEVKCGNKECSNILKHNDVRLGLVICGINQIETIDECYHLYKEFSKEILFNELKKEIRKHVIEVNTKRRLNTSKEMTDHNIHNFYIHKTKRLEKAIKANSRLSLRHNWNAKMEQYYQNYMNFYRETTLDCIKFNFLWRECHEIEQISEFAKLNFIEKNFDEILTLNPTFVRSIARYFLKEIVNYLQETDFIDTYKIEKLNKYKLKLENELVYGNAIGSEDSICQVKEGYNKILAPIEHKMKNSSLAVAPYIETEITPNEFDITLPPKGSMEYFLDAYINGVAQLPNTPPLAPSPSFSFTNENEIDKDGSNDSDSELSKVLSPKAEQEKKEKKENIKQAGKVDDERKDEQKEREKEKKNEKENGKGKEMHVGCSEKYDTFWQSFFKLDDSGILQDNAMSQQEFSQFEENWQKQNGFCAIDWKSMGSEADIAFYLNHFLKHEKSKIKVDRIGSNEMQNIIFRDVFSEKAKSIWIEKGLKCEFRAAAGDKRLHAFFARNIEKYPEYNFGYNDSIPSASIDRHLWIGEMSFVTMFVLASLHPSYQEYLRNLPDSCLVNVYRNASDHVNPHSDKEPMLDRNKPICSISIGQRRKMEFYDSRNRQLIATTYLNDGDLVVMPPGSQSQQQHAIPKWQDGSCRPRINFTLRYLNKHYVSRKNNNSVHYY